VRGLAALLNVRNDSEVAFEPEPNPESVDTSAYRLFHLDVFTDAALEGNPLAVFPDARGIDDHTMQRLAREMNLSETVFVLPATRPGCDAKVRIFTPAAELAFAGHPTIGTSFVLRTVGAVAPDAASLVLEENIGPVPVRFDAGTPPKAWLRTPPITFGRTFDRIACAAALGLTGDDLYGELPVETASAGSAFAYVALRDPAAVDRAVSDARAIRDALGSDGPLEVFLFAPVESGVYARMFAPEIGIVEDPATGSAAGPLAAYLVRHGLVPGDDASFICEQGVKMGRRSVLHVRIDAAGIDVGGSAVILFETELHL